MKVNVPDTPLQLNFSRMSEFTKFSKVNNFFIQVKKNHCQFHSIKILIKISLKTRNYFQTSRYKPRWYNFPRWIKISPWKSKITQNLPIIKINDLRNWYWQKWNHKLYRIPSKLNVNSQNIHQRKPICRF